MSSLACHKGGVVSITVCEAYGIIVSGSEDGLAIVWDLHRLKLIRRLVCFTGSKQDNVLVVPSSNSNTNTSSLFGGSWLVVLNSIAGLNGRETLLPSFFWRVILTHRVRGKWKGLGKRNRDVQLKANPRSQKISRHFGRAGVSKANRLRRGAEAPEHPVRNLR